MGLLFGLQRLPYFSAANMVTRHACAVGKTLHHSTVFPSGARCRPLEQWHVFELFSFEGAILGPQSQSEGRPRVRELDRWSRYSLARCIRQHDTFVQVLTLDECETLLQRLAYFYVANMVTRHACAVGKNLHHLHRHKSRLVRLILSCATHRLFRRV